jgi:hypothetical protein
VILNLNHTYYVVLEYFFWGSSCCLKFDVSYNIFSAKLLMFAAMSSCLYLFYVSALVSDVDKSDARYTELKKEG